MSCVSQQYTPLSSPRGGGPATPRIGSDLCLYFCRLLDHSFIASDICLLVGEAGIETCAGFLVGGPAPPTGRCSWVSSPLLGKAMSRGSCRRLSAGGCGCVPVLLVVWPEASQFGAYRLLEGQVLVSKWQPLGKLMLLSTPQCLPPVSVSPR